ncbi:unnamed protein product [Arctogadus glacialis]
MISDPCSSTVPCRDLTLIHLNPRSPRWSPDQRRVPSTCETEGRQMPVDVRRRVQRCSERRTLSGRDVCSPNRR